MVREMVQQLRAPAVILEDLSLIPNAHMTAHVGNSRSRGSNALFWTPWSHAHMWQTFRHIHTHKINKDCNYLVYVVSSQKELHFTIKNATLPQS